MNTLRSLLLVSFLSGLCLAAAAQKVDSMMNIYRDNFPHEKIYVQFDKSYYTAGDKIWFKAYLMNGPFQSDISRTVFAELVNENGTVVQQATIPVLNASAASNFEIPTNYSGRSLYFRAYTKWMLNFDTAFLFEKNLPLITTASTAATKPAAANATSFQFFPEGGDLVSALESVLAFKANDKYGLPVKVRGYIKNAAGKKVTDFATGHDGMGSLKFTPAKGETYAAVWKDSTNKETTTALPQAKETGVVLNAMGSTGSVVYTVKRSEEGGNDFKQLIVEAHMDQQLVYRAKMKLEESSSNSGRIPVDQLPSGILQVTVFTADWKPLAERVVFVNNNDYVFDAQFRPLLKNLAKRGKNVIEIEVSDTSLSNLSVAVTDLNANAPLEGEDNIYSHLLLAADLKGYIHNPGYYFNSFADSVVQQLDLVMLTHGWRRFKWEDLVQGKLPQIKYPVEDYITLNGTAVGVDPSKLGKDNQMNLIIQYKDSSKQFMFVDVSKGGKFTLPGLVFYDTAKVYYQLNGKNRQNGSLSLSMDNDLLKGYPFLQALNANKNVGLLPPADVIAKNKALLEQSIQQETERSKKAKMLEEVVVRARTKSAEQKLDERYTSGLFRGGDGYSFDLTSDVAAGGYISLFNYLQGKVPGLQISSSGPTGATLSWRGGSPDLYLDEIRTDASAISSMSMSDIAYVKVMRPPFFGSAGGGGNGAIAVYTKKGGDATGGADFKGMSQVTISGYTPVREFYSPNYAQDNPLNDLTDLRTTIYWAPYIFLGKEKKKISLNFYNNDISKSYRVVIEGVNDAGKLTRVEEIVK
ncbi:MAG: hypothetical protein INR73_23065 [Williamsia sp.]|nr:hypothetical protein [Williamsia sp.]